MTGTATIPSENDRTERLEKLRCGLCGFAFRREESVKACKACSSFLKCNLLKCPNCGYEFPAPETVTGKFLKSIISKLRLQDKKVKKRE